MDTLQRHDLVCLSDAGWRTAAMEHDDDAQARQSVAHWARHDLPLVVATQAPGLGADGRIALGLPAPMQWGRRRIALRIAPAHVRRGIAAFPCWRECVGAIRRSVGGEPAALERCLATLGHDPRVFGSFGWQRLTGLDYVREGSDLDLLVSPARAADADAIAAALLAADTVRPRLDGELRFADGSAVAWREWAAWRAGRARCILVKRLHGPSLVSDARWLEDESLASAVR